MSCFTCSRRTQMLRRLHLQAVASKGTRVRREPRRALLELLQNRSTRSHCRRMQKPVARHGSTAGAFPLPVASERKRLHSCHAECRDCSGLHHDQRDAEQRRRGLPNQDSRRLLCHSRFLPVNAKHLTPMAPRIGHLSATRRTRFCDDGPMALPSRLDSAFDRRARHDCQSDRRAERRREPQTT